MPADDSCDQFLLEQARDRARLLRGSVGGDLDALRAAGSDAVYADGATVCEEVAGAVGQLLEHLDTELLAAAAAAAETGPEIHPASENPAS